MLKLLSPCLLTEINSAIPIPIVLKVLFVVTTFISIRFLMMCIFTPGHQIAILTVGGCLLLFYFETALIHDSVQVSTLVRTKVRNIYKRRDEMFKSIGCTWDLNYEFVYPNLKLDKSALCSFWG